MSDKRNRTNFKTRDRGKATPQVGAATDDLGEATGPAPGAPYNPYGKAKTPARGSGGIGWSKKPQR